MREVLRHLPLALESLQAHPDLSAPAETGRTFADNARLKALYYAQATGCWCLADDSGLVVDALDGAPGVHSARYAAERFAPGADRPARDAANIAKLIEALEAVGDDRRTARFVCHLALAEPGRVLLEADGCVEGVILREPRGSGGFGYDPVFLVPAEGRTTAEMSPREKNALSHRGRAARRFAELLEAMLREQPAP